MVIGLPWSAYPGGGWSRGRIYESPGATGASHFTIVAGKHLFHLGRGLRADMNPNDIGRIELWRRTLRDFVPRAHHRHESYALRACHLAVDAARLGTYGVGALLFDANGKIIVEGHNKVHAGGFRSDLHAEMVVMNDYEAARWPPEKARECTLVTSLEPCPMCMARLIVAGIGAVLYLAEDPWGGMVSRKQSLPPTFRAIIQSEGQTWQLAECSDQLSAAARGIWTETRERVRRRLPRAQERRDERIAAS